MPYLTVEARQRIDDLLWRIGFILLQIWGQPHDLLLVTSSCNFHVFSDLIQNTFRFLAPKMALAALHTHNLAGLGHPKTLSCRLVSFQLIFLLFLGHLLSSITCGISGML